MKRITRRDIIKILVSLSAHLPVSLLLAAPTGNSENADSFKALGPYLDTLLPEDSSPSASQLEVDKELIALTRANSRFLQLITLGCAWLDLQASKQGVDGFTQLSPDKRASIVSEAEQSPEKSLAFVFFTQTRSLAFQIYYARPESWLAIGYAGPPQPRGFLNQAQAPEAPGNE